MTDFRIEPTPAAKHVAVVGQDTPPMRPVPEGGDCALQDRPPVVVLMMVDPAPRLPLFPTATQAPGAEQEIPVTSTAFAGAVWVDHV